MKSHRDRFISYILQPQILVQLSGVSLAAGLPGYYSDSPLPLGRLQRRGNTNSP